MFIANLCLIDLLTASTMLPLNVASYALGNMVRHTGHAELDQLRHSRKTIPEDTGRYSQLATVVSYKHFTTTAVDTLLLFA